MEINFKGKKRKYQMTSDEKQFTLSELVKAQTGKSKGELIVKSIGHYSKLEDIFKKAL